MLKQALATFLATSVAFADDSTNSTLTGAADGPWTGHDWTFDTMQIGVKNGLPYGMDDATNRKITSP